MQTFLPYPDFQKTVECLDWRRLNKQRVEAMQILNTLNPNYNKKGWMNHPAVKMWRGYESALKLYMNYCINEWIHRGYKNNMKLATVTNLILPPWIGNTEFHASHKSNLLRKDPKWYQQFGWTETPDLDYIWPES